MDIYINKLDTNGNYLWTKSIGGNNNDNSTSCKVDKEGNLFVAGNVYGIMNEITGEVTQTGVLKNTAFVSKLDASGNFIWIKKFEVENYNYLSTRSLEIGASGNIYLTGEFNGSVSFDSSIDSLKTTGNAYTTDAFICKLDASGNFVWVKKIGGKSRDISNKITVDAAENLYITGAYEKTVDFDPSVNVFELTSAYYDTTNYKDPTKREGSTAFICKYDSDGNFTWAKSIDGQGAYGKAIVVDENGNVYAAGTFGDKCDVDPGTTVDYRASKGGTDSYLCKLNTDGSLIWAKTVGGAGKDYGDMITSLALDVNGDIYATGSFRFGEFPVGSGVFLDGFGTSDVFVLKLKSTSESAWAKRVGGRLKVSSSSIEIDKEGSVYLFGGYYGVGIFNPAVVVYDDSRSDNLTSIKHRSEFTQDIYVVKWTQDGILANEKNLASLSQIDVYPNPTNGSIKLSENITSVEVYSAHGLEILNNLADSNEIDLSLFSSGIYFIKYTNNQNEVITKKIVKN